jgi:hypothetical protein
VYPFLSCLVFHVAKIKHYVILHTYVLTLNPFSYFSDEDINVKGLVSAWLKSQNESSIRFLIQLIEDYFYKGETIYLGRINLYLSGILYFFFLLIVCHVICFVS